MADPARIVAPAPSPPDEPTFERGFVEEHVFLQVLGAALSAMDDAELPYVVIGGIPSSVMGRPRWTEDGADIDLFIMLQDLQRTLAALEGAGFATKEHDPHWLYKASKDGVLVDVIFRSTGDIYLDDEMVERSFVGEFKGIPVRLVSPEDLVVMKAIAHNEQTARYWHDALGVLGRADVDWDYLMRRALQYGAHRVLSLLLYAQSNDIGVPTTAVSALYRAIYEP